MSDKGSKITEKDIVDAILDLRTTKKKQKIMIDGEIYTLNEQK